MTKRSFEDIETGEVSHFLMLKQAKEKQEFGKLFRGRLLDLARDKTASKINARILFAVVLYATPDGEIALTKAQIARLLGYGRSNVGKQFKLLRELGIVVRAGTEVAGEKYYLDPNFYSTLAPIARKAASSLFRERIEAQDQQDFDFEEE